MPAAAPIPAPYLEYAAEAALSELSAATADALFNAQMNVERLLSELAQ